ncbi:MAG: hypothetical protein WC876_07115 [Candidatus Thermoplasmatota archaeon]|jgi:hypothetical protein
MKVAWVLLALLATVPASDAQSVSAPVGSTPTTLYMHLLDVQDFPVNTQEPDPRFTNTPAIGLAANTLTCLPNPPTGGAPIQDFHTWHGYSTPTYVEYDFTQDGKPRTNPIRGLSWNVSLDAAVPPTLHWYLAVRSTPDGANPVPIPVANVVVEAAIRAPDAISLDDSGYETGPAIAAGRSAPALLAGDATQGAEHFIAAGTHVYGFTVPLAYQADSIPGTVGYTITIRAFIDTPACPVDNGGVMTGEVVPYADADHWPRIDLAARDVLRIESLAPRFDNGSVRIDAVFNSVWGSYDVDEDNVTVDIQGPDGPVAVQLETFVQRTHEWAHFTEPVRATWSLPDEGGLPSGLYRVTLTVNNDQKTATVAAYAAFQLDPNRAYPAQEGGLPPEPGIQAMPSVASALLALGLLVAVASRRRVDHG